MEVIELDMDTEMRDLQQWNAELPMDVTESGMEKVTSDSQYENA